MEERMARVAKNEALFRTVNEKMRELNDAFSMVSDTFSIVCECGDTTCTEQIALSGDDYERLRSESITFAVIRGHVIGETEAVVEVQETYDVVRKRPGSAVDAAT